MDAWLVLKNHWAKSILSGLGAPAAAAAVSTDGADEPVDHLEGAQTDLNQTSDQQDWEQGQMPRDDITRTGTFLPQRTVGQVVSVDKWVRGVNLFRGSEALGPVINGHTRHNNGVAGTHRSSRGEQNRAEHRETFSAALIPTAAAAVVVLQAQENQRREDHQHTRSQDSSKVKDFFCDVAALFDYFTAWEKQHNVADDTDDGQREEGYPQAFGEISRTHNSVFA